ncbi:MAG TPA: nucleotide exchange factor GrpE, partial [Candidatus Nanoarchaeia archaeon]|nr:nucleotide exchange factor GrpE [Candidatus Nanoarchaeia archaeon]
MKAKGSAKPQEDKEYSGGGTKETKEDTLEEKPVPTPLAEKDQEKDQRIADLTESLQRLQAEFENFMKRNKKETELLRKYAEEEFIRKLLPIIDSFEHGLKECKEETEFARGMQMIYGQFWHFLKQSGVAPINAKGKFDPNLHDVMLQEE